MSRRIQIATMRNARILSEIRAAVRTGLDADRVADFLANVDWSTVSEAPSGIRDRLGLLEAWATAYAEGELSRSAYVARLLSLLPKRERALRLVMGGGAEITLTEFPPTLHPDAPQSPIAPAPQAHQVAV